MNKEQRPAAAVALLGVVALIVGAIWLMASSPAAASSTTSSEFWNEFDQSSGSITTINNPVMPTNFPDPFILSSKGIYYAYATNSATENLPTFQSTNLSTWANGPDALPQLPQWALSSRLLRLTWAPSVLQQGPDYILFYATADKANDLECISRVEGLSPLGPFADESTHPLLCQTALGGDIDPDVFVDRNGQKYLLWKSDGNCCGMRSELWSERLSGDGTTLIGPAVRLLIDDQAWEAGIVEGPSMVRNGSLYYLFFSGNDWSSAKYAVGYAVCSSPQGPCAEPVDHSLYSSDRETTGPGGEAFFTTFEGHLLMVYAAWSSNSPAQHGGGRSMHLDPITFVDGVPRIQGPTAGRVNIPT